MKVKRKCKICGTVFKGTKVSVYCSEECRKQGNKKSNYEYFKRIINDEPLVRKCLVCDKEFIPTKNQLYCSATCRSNKWKVKKYTEKILNTILKIM